MIAIQIKICGDNILLEGEKNEKKTRKWEIKRVHFDTYIYFDILVAYSLF